jgi:hypothetical protein
MELAILFFENGGASESAEDLAGGPPGHMIVTLGAAPAGLGVNGYAIAPARGRRLD